MSEKKPPYALGARVSPPDPRDIIFASVVKTVGVSLPPVFSLRDKQSSVKFQYYGSCEGFTAEDIIEWLNPGWLASGRGAYALCKEEDGDPGDEGTYTRNMLKIGVGIGIPSDSDFPNDPGTSHHDYISGLTDEIREAAIEHRFPGFAVCHTLQDVKVALSKGYPVTGTINVYSDYLSTDNTGRLVTPHSPIMEGSHEITFIGWDDSKGLEFKNHWGTSWGQNGYAFIPYDYFNFNGQNVAFSEAYAIVDFIDGKTTIGAPMNLQYPLAGPINITQSFGDNPAYYAKYGMKGHNGLDLHAPSNTNVYAADDGQVIFSGFKGSTSLGYGNYIMIEHTWGYSLYGHLHDFVVTDTGLAGLPQKVKAGDLIAHSDNTGDSTAPHLHFGIRINGVSNPGYFDWVDPLPYILKKGPDKMILVKAAGNPTVYVQSGDTLIGFVDMNAYNTFTAGRDIAIVEMPATELAKFKIAPVVLKI